MLTAGIVLCGGESRRMGRPKLLLSFGPELMLQRVVRLLGEAVQPVVVVAGAEQELPALPSDVAILHDRRPGRGPLEGIAVGLAALRGRVEAAFVTACDAPLLLPAFVRRVIELAADWDVTVPHVGGFDQPLAAVYRTGIVPQVEELLAADRLRPAFLFERVRTRRITAEELADADLELESLINLNSLDDYRAALVLAGLETPPGSARVFGE